MNPWRNREGSTPKGLKEKECADLVHSFCFSRRRQNHFSSIPQVFIPLFQLLAVSLSARRHLDIPSSASDPLGQSLTPSFSSSCAAGGPTWVRTRDLPVMSRWLFQLSYGPFLYYSPSPRRVNPHLLIANFRFKISNLGFQICNLRSAISNWDDFKSRGSSSVSGPDSGVAASSGPLLQSAGSVPG